MLNSSLNVHFFGFSVTRFGNPSYPVHLAKRFSDNGCRFNLTFSALGGVSLECVPFIVDHLKQHKPDILVLEVATSHYSMRKRDVNSTIEILHKVLDSVSSFCNQVFFLLLPRTDFVDGCTVPEALKVLSPKFNFNTIDLLDLVNATDYFVDNVHPTEAGIEKISNSIFQYFTDLSEIAPVETRVVINHSCGEVAFKNYVGHHQFPLLRYFQLTNFSFVAVPILLSDSFSFKFEFNCYLHGLFYIMGPDTSSIHIESKNIDSTILTHDQHSYYYRVGYTPFDCRLKVEKNQPITISATDNRSDVKLLKESKFHVAERVNYPISFSIEMF
jgi:hypothetical protein